MRHARHRIAVSLALAAALALAPGCGHEQAKITGPPPPTPARTYHLVVQAVLTEDPIANANVVARTADTTIVATTDAAGAATLIVPNELALPPHLVVTIGEPAHVATAVRFDTGESVVQSAKLALESAPANLLLRQTTLVRLGDGTPDGIFDDLQVPVDSLTISIPFVLAGVPVLLPNYRVAVRGLESAAELRIDGHVVGTLAPPADGSALSILEGPLVGDPAQALGPGPLHVFQVRTVVLEGRPGNFDDFELGALTVWEP